MEGELEYGGGRGRGLTSSQPSNSETYERVTYTQVFEKAFPEYLAMGMTYELYWNQDASLVKAYRKAHEIRRDEQNFFAWLNGKYVYDAIGALAPILRTSLSKVPAKAEKYIDKPYPLSESAVQKQQEDRQKSKFMAALERFKAEAAMNRQKRLQKEKEAREQNGE